MVVMPLDSVDDQWEKMGGGQVATPVSVFSQQDVNDGIVWYRHIGQRTTRDFVRMSISDSANPPNVLHGQELIIHIVAEFDSPPEIAPDVPFPLGMQVFKDQITRLSSSQLAFVDGDSENGNLLYNITFPLPATYGSIEHAGRLHHAVLLFTQADVDSGKIIYRPPSQALVQGYMAFRFTGDVFTYDELINNRLNYIHDGSETSEDSLVLRVSDGLSTASATLVFAIERGSDLHSQFEADVHLSAIVAEKGRVALKHENLPYTASDVRSLHFMLLSLPIYGALVQTEPHRPDHELPIYTAFTMEDVFQNRIWYTTNYETRGQPMTDLFYFTVSDGKGNRIEKQMFTITIVPRGERTPHLSISTTTTVQEGGKVMISSNEVFVSDTETPKEQLFLHITDYPKFGKLERVSQGSSSEVATRDDIFTMQEVSDGMLYYVQSTHRGIEPVADAFLFYLTDGAYRSPTYRFNITIELTNDEAPEMQLGILHVQPGTVSILGTDTLIVKDMDTPMNQLIFTLTTAPRQGTLQRRSHRGGMSIMSEGAMFSYEELTEGHIVYSAGSSGREADAIHVQLFDGVHVQNGEIHISIIRPSSSHLSSSRQSLDSASDGEHLLVVQMNKELLVEEGALEKLDTSVLSASDGVTAPNELQYSVSKGPALGRLEYTSKPGAAIKSFTQADLAARKVQYVHTSTEEKPADEFDFIVSDGLEEVSGTIHIRIKPVDDSLPILQSGKLKLQEGLRKTITEFELKATDADTPAEDVTFKVVQPPRHGKLELAQDGQAFHSASTFSMADILQGRVSYSHDGSNSLHDHFSFTVSDGTNPFFLVLHDGKKTMTAALQRFSIEVSPVDDSTPRIVVNHGIHWLEYTEGQATNSITKKDLLTVDPDTSDDHIVYEMTSQPKLGFLENKLQPGVEVKTFTQEDVNLGVLRYVLREDAGDTTRDSFQFLVKDNSQAVVNGNTFYIQWSLISFQKPMYHVNETAGMVSIAIKRTGNLNQYAIILCRTEPGTATSTAGPGSQLGAQDYVEYAGQVQFEEQEDSKTCTIGINDDSVFEGLEQFSVELSMPAYALFGETTSTVVVIADEEDASGLQFDRKLYRVKEGDGQLHAIILRKGDSSAMVSVICYTQSSSARGSRNDHLASGSDFVSRPHDDSSRVTFPPGVTSAPCDVNIVDDSASEPEEAFELVLAQPSEDAHIGRLARARVIIAGPNDASVVAFSELSFTVREDAGTVEIPLVRQGSDLSVEASVWCATRPSQPASATPGMDYVASSKRVVFPSGKMEATCPLTILDDAQRPALEGNETFVMFLNTAQGVELAEPSQSTVIIDDSYQDVPSMQFEKEKYEVEEAKGVLTVHVLRSGDLSSETTVRCYTRQGSAIPREDYTERPDADASTITFQPGDKVKNCTVYVIDDTTLEAEEEFHLVLGRPLSGDVAGARVGSLGKTKVTITNKEDAPTLQFEQASYQVLEPSVQEGMATITLHVVRTGDRNKNTRVRCSTRDGSAQSGLDYNPKSRILKFKQGVARADFSVEILANDDREWHESFSVVLGPDEPVEAVLGEITMATVTIIDQEASGSLILPSPPIVVSLADYDDLEGATNEGSKQKPSPGYPLVCVTPCDPHYPKFSQTRERCEEGGINSSTIHFKWEVSSPSDNNGARTPFETITDKTPYTSANHMVLESIYFGRKFHVRCLAQARDRKGQAGIPLRSTAVVIGSDNAICHTPVSAGAARGFQAQSFVASLMYLDVKHKEHPNRIHISIQIPHQDGMLPLISTMPIQNLHLLLSESIYRQQHVCSNLLSLDQLKGISEAGFLDTNSSRVPLLAPGYDRPYQFDATVREARAIQLYHHLNLKSCIWTFDAYYHMTELLDVCGGSVSADFQVRDSAQSYLTVMVPLYVSYIYVTAPRGWASLEHHTEMEFSFFYDTVLWRMGIQTDSVLSARLQVIRIYIREDGRLVIEFKTQAKFRGQFVLQHHTLPDQHSRILPPEHLGDIEFELELVWSAQTFDSPYQLWRAISSYNRKDYSGEYTVYLVPCTVQPTQSWLDPSKKGLSCTAHAAEKFLLPISFQQTNRPVPVVYSLNTEFHLCNNDKVFLMDPSTTEMSLQEMDYKGSFSMGQTLFGRVLWNPKQNLDSAYRLVLENVYLCTGRNGYVPFFDPTGTIYNEGPQYGCIQPNKNLKHRFLLLDRNHPEMVDQFFHDVPFNANFAGDVSEYRSMRDMPGMDGFFMKVDALYKVEAGHQWYLQAIYLIGPESASPRLRRSLVYKAVAQRVHRDLVDARGKLMLHDSLIYDGDDESDTRNGTNMKMLHLEQTRTSQAMTAGIATGGGVAIFALAVALIVACMCLLRQGSSTKFAPKGVLNHKVEVVGGGDNGKLGCETGGTYMQPYRNINLLEKNEGVELRSATGVRVKQINLHVKVHNNLRDGTEV
uniref:extracellular matrix organizing protein FRAS1 isoform X2 n=1 Tax=Myxine glutinosa TaxID=7769 RepID=UPI00359004A1